MRVLVTGGAGFIGSHVVDALLRKGDRVWVLDDLSSGDPRNLDRRAVFIKCELGSRDLQVAIMEAQPEVVFHLAAQIDVKTSVMNPTLDAQTNVMGSISLLNACVAAGVRKVIYSSSAAVYGEPRYVPIDETHSVRPLSPYGISKHTVEHYLEAYSCLHSLDYTVLRYANVYGPRQDARGEGGVVSVFIDRAISGEDCLVHGSGLQTRDFVYVEDVAAANIAAISRGGRDILHVSTGTEVTVIELLDLVREVSGSRFQQCPAPAREGDIFRSCLDNSRTLSELGWSPLTNLREGLRSTVDWARARASQAV